MSVTFFNNWKQIINADFIEEFRVVELTFKMYEEDKQFGVFVSLMGFGIVLMFNT